MITVEHRALGVERMACPVHRHGYIIECPSEEQLLGVFAALEKIKCYHRRATIAEDSPHILLIAVVRQFFPLVL